MIPQLLRLNDLNIHYNKYECLSQNENYGYFLLTPLSNKSRNTIFFSTPINNLDDQDIIWASNLPELTNQNIVLYATDTQKLNYKSIILEIKKKLLLNDNFYVVS